MASSLLDFPRSIRWRTQFWHGLILLLVVASFGSILYTRLWHTQYQRIDSELEAAGQLLVSVLETMPPHELDPLIAAPRPGRPPPGAGGRPAPPPNRRPPRPAPPILKLPESFQQQRDSDSPFFIVWRGGGDVLDCSPGAPRLGPTDWPELSTETPIVFQQRGDVRQAYFAGPTGSTVVVGRSIRREQSELAQWRFVLVGAGAGALALGIAGGFWLSHRALQPLRTMSAAATKISADNLGQRLDAKEIDSELADLAGTLNAAFDRLQEAFERQARFTADASHELRTPLTVILGHLDLAVTEAKKRGAPSEALEASLRAARRMKTLVEQLLLLARADAGKLEPHPQAFDLGATVEECVDLLTPLARKKGITIHTEIEPAEVTGEPELLAQVVVNLVTNAIQHNRTSGEVRVAVTSDAGTAQLAVADTGPGIPATAQQQLFERFYRADSARSRRTGGSGLGLAIAHSIVLAHRGEITCRSEVGQGTEFVVRLPAKPTGPPTNAAR